MMLASRLRNVVLQVVRSPRDFIQFARSVGIGMAAQFFARHILALALSKTGRRVPIGNVSVWVRGIDHSLIVRPATSDYGVFKQIFIEHEYAPLSGIRDPQLIVDCGANVGYSSVYFLNRFPTARVVAVEPDPANVDICRQNIAAYGDRVQLLPVAVWPRAGRLTLLHYGGYGDRGESGVQVYETPRATGDTPGSGAWPEHVHQGPNPPVPIGHVDAMDMYAIIRAAGDMPIDILKMDIENAELELFRDGELGWLTKVRNIAIELHGNAARDAFFRALGRYRYEGAESGELTICRDLASSDG